LNSYYRIFKKFLLFFVFLICLTACLPISNSGQTIINETPKKIDSKTSLGQSFYVRNNGLQGLNIFISSVEKPGKIYLKLFDSSTKSTLITNSNAELSVENSGQNLYFPFDRPISSTNEDFYMVLESSDAVGYLGIASPTSYSWGSMYENDHPIENQMVFSLSFRFAWVLIGILEQFLLWFKWILIGTSAFLFPGHVIFRIFWKQRFTWGEELGIAAGIGFVIYPLILLWTNFFGLQLHAWNTLILIIFSAFYVIYHLWKNRNLINRKSFLNKLYTIKINKWVILGYGFALLGIIFSRFWAIRSLEAPLWGDSVQHSVMTQLILDKGGLFANWLPYAPFKSLTVQYGFSANSAVFSWLTGFTSLYSTLIVGQIANIFSIISIFPLAYKLSGKNPWAGITSMLVAGLLMPIPAFYVNWGRFAQLAGQVVLPIAIFLIWNFIDEFENKSWQKISLLGLVISGMFLNYYRMAFYFATFVLSILIFTFSSIKKNKLKHLKILVLKIVSILILSVIIFLPWGIKVAGSSLAQSVESGMTTSIPLQTVIDDYQTWKYWSEFIPTYLLILFASAGFLAIFIKDWKLLSVVIWTLLLSFYKATQIFNFPGANMMQSFAVLIASYIPISLVVAWLFLRILTKIPNFKWKQAFVFSIITVGVLFGTNQTRKIVNEPFFGIIKHPDMTAMKWIDENTPKESKFLIEGFRIYDGKSIVGSDGGWYIPLLANRENTIPPQYALLNEEEIEEGYSQKAVELVAFLENESLSSQLALDKLCDDGITNVYIGQDHGDVGEGENQLFDQNELKSPFYDLLYAHDRVKIYKINQDYCAP